MLFVIAIYGAVLSTFNWRQAAKKDRRQITIRALTTMPTFGDQLGAPYAKLEAVNTSHGVVVVEASHSKLRPARLLADSFAGIPDTRLPVSLSDGQSA